MEQQYVTTHTIYQTEIQALLDSWITCKSFVKIFYPQQTVSVYIFVKTRVLKCWSVEDLSSFFCLL
jgi:DNA-binding XRE family transcriptional regulator